MNARLVGNVGHARPVGRRGLQRPRPKYPRHPIVVRGKPVASAMAAIDSVRRSGDERSATPNDRDVRRN